MAEEQSQNNNAGPLAKADVTLASGLHTFSDYDVRGIGMDVSVAPLKDSPNIVVPMKFIEIPTPAWFPDSFLRSRKRNLYFNMVNSAAYYGSSYKDANNERGGKFLDFYKDTSTENVLIGLAKSALNSIVSTAANQVMSVANKVDSVRNGVRSLFGGGSSGPKSELMANMRSEARDPFLNSQPYIKLYGIHLAENIRDAYNAVHSVGKALSTTFSSILDTGNVGMMQNLKDLFKGMNEGFVKALKDLGFVSNAEAKKSDDNLTNMISEFLTNADRRMHNFSEAQMLSSISGNYTLTGRIPFFNNAAPMFTSSGENSFDREFSRRTEGLGDDVNLIKMVERFTNVAWFRPLTWAPNKIFNSSMTPVNYSFNIFNDTIEHALLNLAFIFSFGATTQAVTDICTIRPPYLFDVEIPGGLMFKYCLCTFKVYPQGKLRRINPVNIDGKNVFDEGDGTFLREIMKEVYGLNINPRAITFIPDYYKVTLQFKSVLPNLWNFIHSYLFDANSAPVIGAPIQHLLTKALKSFSNNFSSAMDNLRNASVGDAEMNKVGGA